MPVQLARRAMVLAFLALGCSLCRGQVSQQSTDTTPVISTASIQKTDQQQGTIRGTVVDQSGAVVLGARVSLTRSGEPLSSEVLTGSDGQFSFTAIAPGPFQIIVNAVGFALQTSSGILHPAENYTASTIALTVAMDVTNVEVGLPQVEVAEEQMKVEEKQRVLGVLPNFYVSYIPNAVPLTSKQKFRLAAKTVVDPFTFVFVGGSAGVEQWQNHFRGYGQGAEGYAKRFGAGYADTVSGTFIGNAILPSILKQDPRYFYKGTGSIRSRFLYAIANAFICKGDNGHWQPNYSAIGGGLAAGGISNLYYPSQDRNGVQLTFENAAIGTAGTAFSNVLQEFLIKKLTPRIPHNNPPTP